ncbi:unnamed protein product [Discosporangium mesarthrocarpum]
MGLVSRWRKACAAASASECQAPETSATKLDSSTCQVIHAVDEHTQTRADVKGHMDGTALGESDTVNTLAAPSPELTGQSHEVWHPTGGQELDDLAFPEESLPKPLLAPTRTKVRPGLQIYTTIKQADLGCCSDPLNRDKCQQPERGLHSPQPKPTSTCVGDTPAQAQGTKKPCRAGQAEASTVLPSLQTAAEIAVTSLDAGAGKMNVVLLEGEQLLTACTVKSGAQVRRHSFALEGSKSLGLEDQQHKHQHHRQASALKASKDRGRPRSHHQSEPRKGHLRGRSSSCSVDIRQEQEKAQVRVLEWKHQWEGEKRAKYKAQAQKRRPYRGADIEATRKLAANRAASAVAVRVKLEQRAAEVEDKRRVMVTERWAQDASKKSRRRAEIYAINKIMREKFERDYAAYCEMKKNVAASAALQCPDGDGSLVSPLRGDQVVQATLDNQAVKVPQVGPVNTDVTAGFGV